MTNNRVTQRDIYDALNRLEDKMDVRFDEALKITGRNLERITVLEYWKANLTGKIAGAVAVISIVVSLATDWIKKKIE